MQQEVISENKHNGIFALASRKQDYLDISLSVGNEIKDNYANLVIFGMGGSIVSAKLLYFYQHYKLNRFCDHYKKVIFFDNLYNNDIISALNKIDFSNTAFLFISKSGNTTEVISQLLLIIDAYQQAILENNAVNFYFITQNNDNPLVKIAQRYCRPIIEHDSDVSGRYACFTPVALIPAVFFGLDIEDYLNQAENLLNDFIKKDTVFLQKNVYFLHKNNKNNNKIHVVMPYYSSLSAFNDWYEQLFSESISKQGNGINILTSIGCTDQHSLLQLFLDGPQDKFFTFIVFDIINNNIIKVPKYLYDDFAFIDNINISNLININANATISALADKGCAIRKLQLNENNLGYLLMYFMLETILYAKLIGINPFDQPIVEITKKLVKKTCNDLNNL